MTPLFAVANPRDARRRNTVFARKVSSFDSPRRTDLACLVISQLRAPVLFATMTGAASFLVSIPHVIEIGSQPEVVRSTARPYVTMMKHMQPIRNLSMRQLPRKSVGLVAPVVKKENTIARIMNWATPQPTRFCLFDLLPKERLGGYSQPTASKSTRDTAKLLWVRRIRSELCAANGAYAGRLDAILRGHGSSYLSCRAWDVSSIARHFRVPIFLDYITKTARCAR